jgi:hypothetical protein
MVLSIEELVFLVDHVFREGNRYTDLVQEQHLHLIAMQFVDLMRNFVKQVQC